MKRPSRFDKNYNVYEDYSVAMLCRKFDFSYIKEGGLERTMCSLPVDIEPLTGLKETLYKCPYGSKYGGEGRCMLLEKQYF